jgi:ketol-acid reductoisomerase
MAEISSKTFFTINDAEPGMLEGERIAIFGYGHLGRPFALNIRDSGIDSLTIGNIDDDYAAVAEGDGFIVKPPADAAKDADILFILLPDEVIPDIYPSELAPNISPGSAIVFASGYTLAYDLIEPSNDIDILLLAPRMAGENARQRYINGEGFFAYISVEQDYSDHAWKRLLGLSNAVGVLNAGAMNLNAKQEADLDLFIEQTVGAILGVSIMAAFSIGVDAGIPEEALVMEMYYSQEMEMVWRSFREKGFFKASEVHGPTALYGGFIRTMSFMQSGLGETFEEILAEIQDGEFAHRFQEERASGYPMLSQAQSMTMEDSPISQAEGRLKSTFG